MAIKEYYFTASQTKVIQSDKKFTLFCAGFGSGKSFLMGFNVVSDAMHSNDAVIGVYEPEKKHIRTTAVPAVEFWLKEFSIDYTYNKHENTIYCHTNGVGDIMFFPMDNPATLVAYETYRTHIDEFDTLKTDKAREIWIKILGRNRKNPQDIPESEKVMNKRGKLESNNKITVYTTPEGYRFCYKNWYAKPMPNSLLVQGRTIENPFLPDGFIEDKQSQYTEQELDAYLNGKFVNLAAGTVFYAFDREIHNSKEEIRPGENLYIGMDFNIYNMSATIYVKRKGGLEWHAVEELHGIRDTGEIIDIITERWKDKGHNITTYPDATGTSGDTAASMSDIAMLQEAGLRPRYKRAKKSKHGLNPKVKDRISATNKGFETMRIFVNVIKCPMVASCFEQQSYTTGGKPDKDSGVDHQNDASSYPIAYCMPVGQKLINVSISFAF